MPHHHDRPHPMRSLLILSSAALAFSLAQTMLIPALGELTYQLDTDASGIAWVLTGYLLAAAVATPVAGRLGDMFGKRRLLVLSLLAFGLGSAVAALGSSLEVVVLGRVLQGFGGGIFPLCFGIIRDEFPREKVAGSIGLISAIFGIGGGAGLIAGGLIADHLSYHWIFWLGAISAALAAIATQIWVPESPERKPGRVDLRGAALLGAGLVMPLIAISRANDWGWGSTKTLVLIARRPRRPRDLGRGREADRAAARRHPDAAQAAGPDDEHRHAARRLRHVRLVPADPAARGAAGLDRLRLRPRRHRRRPAAAARLADDAVHRPDLRRARHALRLEAAARRRRRDHEPRPVRARVRPRQRALGDRLGVRDVDRHRPELRGDGEPDRRGRPAGADRRGDRLQRAHPLGRRVDRLAGHRGDPRRERGGGQPAPDRRRLHRRVPRQRLGRGRSRRASRS